MEEKKISFGFSKTAKKTSLQAGPAASVSQKKPDSKQYIECVEENSIKTVGPTEEIAGPLVIPLRDKDKITIPDRLAKLKIIKQEKLKRLTFKDTTLANSTTEIASAPPNETRGQQTDCKSTQKYPVVPLLPEERLVHLGLESTLDDYERVPIEDFGIAMLRGMGYKEDAKKADGKRDQLHMVQPHPQGTGLDVDLSIRAKALNTPLVLPTPDEEIVVEIGAPVKVVNGIYRNRYGTIKSMGEGTSLDFVKFALDGTTEQVNDYWVIPVSMEEYKQYSKVLNSPERPTIQKDHERPEESRSLPGESVSDVTRKKIIQTLREFESIETVDPKRKRLSHVQKSDEPIENSSTKLTPVLSNETIDQRAIREILEASQQGNDGSNEQSNIVVSLVPEELPLEGAQESTLDDYERVAVKDFGMAMLRGMGLKEDIKKADENRGVSNIGPVMRPKGLGLGADRSQLLKAQNAPLLPPASGEVLVMKTGARVKVVAGKHQDRYGTNGVPERIVLLDWQIARYVTPVLDLAYFIFCGTDAEFRRRHYDEMMAIYYNSLAALLEKLGHNPQEVFPRTALMRQLRTFGRFGVLMAVFLVPMLCTRNEDLVDMDEAAEKYREGEEMDIGMLTRNANQRDYAVRMRGVIKDIVRYGYL